MLFNNWNALLHTLVVGSLGYFALVILLRISGKRTLAKLNAFDFIVTIAFGTILGSILLSTTTSFVQGTLGFGLLVFFQFVITWLSIRFQKVQNWVNNPPTLLLYKGELRHHALKRERVNVSEVRAALRSQGIANLEDVEAVILETDGTFSVIKELNQETASALLDVKGYPNGTSR